MAGDLGVGGLWRRGIKNWSWSKRVRGREAKRRAERFEERERWELEKYPQAPCPGAQACSVKGVLRRLQEPSPPCAPISTSSQTGSAARKDYFSPFRLSVYFLTSPHKHFGGEEWMVDD